MRPRMLESFKRKSITLSLDPQSVESIKLLSKIVERGNQSRIVEDILYDWIEDSLLLSYNDGRCSIHLSEDVKGFEWLDENNEVVQGGFRTINKALSWYYAYQQKEIESEQIDLS